MTVKALKSLQTISMLSKIILAPEAKADLEYWAQKDPRKYKKKKERIKTLIQNILDTPYEGIGKPEALKHNWSGFWSRRIDREHRLIYRIRGDAVQIARCRYHY